MAKTLFLSYPLNDKAFGYGNGDRFKLIPLREMCCGDTSNNSKFEMPTHYGTHIDFPYHFSSEGKKSSDYLASNFIHSHLSCIEIDPKNIENYLIRNKDIKVEKVDKNTTLLFIKTGFCTQRNNPAYWEFGLGFHPETAAYLKLHFPKLTTVAFDLISLNSYQQRAIGREAHQQFLLKQDLLIVEEVDLSKITSATKFEEVIIAPLLLDNTDGAPVTIIAKIR